jgi:flagellar biosynthetic protein FliR
MTLYLPSQNELIVFLLITIRIGAIIFTLPFFGSRNMPIQIKIILVFLLSLGIYPSLENPSMVIPHNGIALTLVVLGETITGFIIGFTAQILFISMQLSGELISQQMGLSLATTLNPQNPSQNSLITNFQYILATLVFFSSSTHHLFILAISESLHIIPIMTLTLSKAVGTTILSFLSKTFITSIKISAPIIVMQLLVAIGIGILARLVPQINIFILSFPINIGVGLLVLSIILIYILKDIKLIFEQFGHDLFLIIRLLGQG